MYLLTYLLTYRGLGYWSRIVHRQRAVSPGNQRLKFADDTNVIVVLVVDADSRQVELTNVEERSRADSLKPNPAKYTPKLF